MAKSNGVMDFGNFERPLILYCSPRGGSSLVAGVFARHGFWTGETFGGADGVGSGGYVNHENAKIKDYMKREYPLDAGNHADQRPDDTSPHDLRAFCHKAVQGDPWMFKGPSEYYFPFFKAFPDHIPVMVFRNPVQSVEAHVRRYGEKVREGAQRVVTARHKFMNAILSNRVDAFRVDAERVVDGDMGQIDRVLAQYNIDLDHRLAMEGISPEMFHR